MMQAPSGSGIGMRTHLSTNQQASEGEGIRLSYQAQLKATRIAQDSGYLQSTFFIGQQTHLPNTATKLTSWFLACFNSFFAQIRSKPPTPPPGTAVPAHRSRTGPAALPACSRDSPALLPSPVTRSHWAQAWPLPNLLQWDSSIKVSHLHETGL